MAFKFSADEKKRLDVLIAKFASEADDVEIEVGEYNEGVKELRAKLDERLEKLNEARDELRGFIEDMHSEMDSQYDDKSEKWKEGERGEATRTWIDKLDEIKGEIEDDIEIDKPEEVEFDPSQLRVSEIIDEGFPFEPEY